MNYLFHIFLFDRQTIIGVVRALTVVRSNTNTKLEINICLIPRG